MPRSYTWPSSNMRPVFTSAVAASTFSGVIQLEAPAWSPAPHWALGHQGPRSRVCAFAPAHASDEHRPTNRSRDNRFMDSPFETYSRSAHYIQRASFFPQVLDAPQCQLAYQGLWQGLVVGKLHRPL